MHFNTIIGNPPYQHNTRSIYQHFIEKSLEFNTDYIIMIVKNNWINSSLIRDTKIKMIKSGLSHIINYPIVAELFDEIGVAVSIFMLDKHNKDYTCNIKQIENNIITSEYNTKLDNTYNIFTNQIEYSIYNKVKNDIVRNNFSLEVLPSEPFRVTSRFCVGYGDSARNLDISDVKTDYYNIDIAYINSDTNDLDYKYININKLQARKELIPNYKIICGGRFNNNKQVITNLHMIDKNSICTGSYAVLYTHPIKEITENVYKYMQTKFVRFLILLMCDNGMTNVHPDRLKLVPIQNFNYTWTDRALYEKYRLNNQEIEYIENLLD